ncbi:hypothetical protein N0V85_002221 [Neurospora sp. IMI 360204]|nr:hypothetical protein N0V85_002221 [Neurospora sp. IMI 360204]
MSVPVCADCFKGTLRGDVIPTGHEHVIHGLPTYIATPEPWVKPLGTTLRNTRALADSYAKRVPCIVYVPDFMDGKSISLSLMASFGSKPDPNSPWLIRILVRSWNIIKAVPVVLLFLYRTRPSVAWPRVRSFISAVRTTPTADGEPPKVGVAGFCWGGLYAVGLTNTQNPENWATLAGERKVPLIDCAFTAHPSMLKLPRHIHEVQLPLSLANGEDDSFMGREKMKEVMRILEDKNRMSAREMEGANMPDAHEVVVYPGAKHGFAVRGDREDPLQKERGDQSEDQAVRWFSKWFGRNVAKEV